MAKITDIGLVAGLVALAYVVYRGGSDLFGAFSNFQIPELRLPWDAPEQKTLEEQLSEAFATNQTAVDQGLLPSFDTFLSGITPDYWITKDTQDYATSVIGALPGSSTLLHSAPEISSPAPSGTDMDAILAAGNPGHYSPGPDPVIIPGALYDLDYQIYSDSTGAQYFRYWSDSVGDRYAEGSFRIQNKYGAIDYTLSQAQDYAISRAAEYLNVDPSQLAF